MEYRILGKTTLKVSSLSFGASSLGLVFRPVDEAEGIRAVHAALDCGINYFDVAPCPYREPMRPGSRGRMDLIMSPARPAACGSSPAHACGRVEMVAYLAARGMLPARDDAHPTHDPRPQIKDLRTKLRKLG